MGQIDKTLTAAIGGIPAGRWAIAVSGGADSVALLHLSLTNPGLSLLAVHLDHQTRQGQSTADARFVAELCARLHVPLVLARREDLEHDALPANPQARYRAMRLALFERVVRDHHLAGILQGHHADDQAETIFMRLLRSSGIEGLCGIPADARLGSIRVLRPLLAVHRVTLRQYLHSHALAWREDASNQSTHYLRNRIRQLLSGRADLVAALLDVGRTFTALARELDSTSPQLPEAFPAGSLSSVGRLPQLHALRQWALARGARPDGLTLALLERLRQMTLDMATPPALCLPGGLEVRRKRAQLSARPTRPQREGSRDNGT